VVNKGRLEALEAGLKAAGPDLSIPLLRTLIAVYLNPNLSVNELADLIDIPQQTASRYVAILQGRYRNLESSSALARSPLLSQRASTADLRRYELALTSRGVAKLSSILDEVFSKGVVQ
jgi:DNA-binding MarR family transcriptional regulator